MTNAIVFMPARSAPSAAARARAADPDFRALLGEAAWARLPAAVQARFATGAHATPCVYAGRMSVRATWLGWAFAQVCRLIGTPLAPWVGEDVPVEVSVSPAPRGGITWSRLYRFAGHAPTAVSSRKLMSPKGDLLEVVRGGLGMRLIVTEEDGAMIFRSLGYVLQAGPWALPLPAVLTPGQAWVEHRDLGGGAFRFSLRFIHALAGEDRADGRGPVRRQAGPGPWPRSGPPAGTCAGTAGSAWPPAAAWRGSPTAGTARSGAD